MTIAGIRVWFQGPGISMTGCGNGARPVKSDLFAGVSLCLTLNEIGDMKKASPIGS